MSSRQGPAAQQQQQQHPAGPATNSEHDRRRLATLSKLKALLENQGSVASQTIAAYSDLLDEIIVDVAQEAHREGRTGTLPPTTPPGPAGAGPSDTAAPGLPPQQPAPGPLPPKPGTKGPVDVFGQSHPAKATDVVTCRNCGRQVQAGSFAPHLEKCMGKGRAAARAASRRLAGQS